ncbi:MAG: M20/M25/M40 family metallo-hydrolase [candidate division KSB1 bacterium]|nr:M20/M25/M40 family metallo-hydrolase [candidate division KSB1 bacterium]MDQ7064745.1 M20/M25/M40 family metallo-hydrolase [candidate division KSB1 bacterium]
MNRRTYFAGVILLLAWVGFIARPLYSQTGDVQKLLAALLQDTPLEEDLQELTDQFGGRPTGSEANLKAVEWGVQKFQDIGVKVWKEPFEMPALWLEESSELRIHGDVSFTPRVVAMPFSVGTPPKGLTAPLVDGGFGTEDDFARLGEKARGAFVLVETHELRNLDDLFREYGEAVEIEKRAFAAGVKGLIYMASRPRNLLYRHNASLGPDNKHPLLVMEREGAKRALRLLRAGKQLQATAIIRVKRGGPYTSYNVVAEIKGREKPEEIVIVGAHLDSWDLGTGALDDGCNVAMLIDIARQIKKLGLQPRRTIRFALWNGEEQGIIGSWKYTEQHEKELDNYVMAASFDIGSGRITGFFTNGRSELLTAVEKALKPVAGLGPFTHINEPLVGTDNLDFMLQGVGNLVANQESANYGPNYHARSDTYDKVDLRQLRLNMLIAAAVTYGFAEMDVTWGRQSYDEVKKLVETTSLADQLKGMGMWESWAKGLRGRRPGK